MGVGQKIGTPNGSLVIETWTKTWGPYPSLILTHPHIKIRLRCISGAARGPRPERGLVVEPGGPRARAHEVHRQLVLGSRRVVAVEVDRFR